MTRDDDLVDLSIAPEAMLAIRDDLRQRLVLKVHFLRLSARLYRKVGDLQTAKQQDTLAAKFVSMIRAIDPMADPLLKDLQERKQNAGAIPEASEDR